MKHITALFLAICFVFACTTTQAQFRLEKRHHLKGYYFDFNGKKAKVNDLKKAEAVSSDQAELEKVFENDTDSPEIVVRETASSPSLVFADETENQHSSNLNAEKLTPVKKQSGKFNAFVRKGAGWLPPVMLTKKLMTKSSPAVQGGTNDTFALVGFILGCLAIIGFGAGMLLFLAIPGLIFSILGLNSGKRGLAIAGVIINALVLFILLLAIIFIASLIAAI